MVHYGRRSRPSALALQRSLTQLGYNGPNINFGYGINPEALNKPEAIRLASNKRLALQAMQEAGVPVPKPLYNDTWSFPCVGRPDSHRQGRGFWLCESHEDMARAYRGTSRKAAATHFMEYIPIEREFRVHVVNGKSIKISEKVGANGTNNHRNGAICRYPSDFSHKKTLRKAAKDAVEALGLDFGAVDIGWYDGKPYVFEVNTAMGLTDPNSDTLERYAQAFVALNKEKEDGNDDRLGVYSVARSVPVETPNVGCTCCCHDDI